MGSGLRYICRNCNREYAVFLGEGGNYHSLYEELYRRALAGEYGEEWEELLETDPGLAMDCRVKLYCCAECGTWTNAASMDLYAVEDRKELDIWRRITREDLFDTEDGPREYVDASLLENCFRKAHEYTHMCPECKSAMERADIGKPPELECPFCGTSNEYAGWMMWD